MAGLNGSLKLQRSSPQSDIHVRAFRLHSPDVADGANGSSPLGFTGANGFASEQQSRLLRQASHSSNLSNGSPSRRHNTPDAPTDGQSLRNGVYDCADVDHTPLSPQSPDTRNGETSDSWSSAVGRATVGGKSGRVIERLQADNDKLRREIKLYSARADEEQKRAESIRSTLDSLRASNQNLETICDTNRTALARKDRKLEELREDLKNEKVRREAAQKAERDAVSKTTEAIVQARLQVAKEQEMAAHASTQYETLRSSMNVTRRDCEQRLEQVSLDVKKLLQRLDEDQKRFESIDYFGRSLEATHKKAVDAHEEMSNSYRTYKETSDGIIASFGSRFETAEQALQVAQAEMIATTGRMKQAINIKKNFKGEFHG